MLCFGVWHEHLPTRWRASVVVELVCDILSGAIVVDRVPPHRSLNHHQKEDMRVVPNPVKRKTIWLSLRKVGHQIAEIDLNAPGVIRQEPLVTSLVDSTCTRGGSQKVDLFTL